MSNFFDKSNNEVVRHSFGSTFGKTFEIKPLEKSKKVSEDEIMMESAAKFAELNKKVETGKRESELNEKLYGQSLKEGFCEFRDSLVKDIMRHICIESLLVDEENVLENLSNIHFLVDNKVDEIGGYEGLKAMAENTQNPLLIDMYKLCESTSNKVSERVLKESKGDRKKLSFVMDSEEEMLFDTNKKDLGVDEISEFVKDKVLTVVKDEQEKKQEEDDMMTEIQNELTDNGVQDAIVQEAMNFVFESKIEDTTLFDSMMRKTYKSLLEHGCSAILESTEIIDDEQGYPVYDVDDVELTDVTIDEDEEVKKLFLETGKGIVDGIDEKDAAKVKANYDKLADGLKEIATGCKKKSRATCVKESIREIQKSTVELVEESAHQVGFQLAKLVVTSSPLGQIKSIAQIIDYIGTTKKILEAELKFAKTKADLKFLRAKLKVLNLKLLKTINRIFTITNRDKTKFEQGFKDMFKMIDDKAKELNIVLESFTDEELVELEEGCKSTEGLSKQIKCSKKVKESTDVESEDDILEEAKCKTKTKESAELDIDDQFDSIEEATTEFINKLDDVCDDLNNVIDDHEEALIGAQQNLYINRDGNSILFPVIHQTDVNDDYLKFAYKTRSVCESIKTLLSNVDNELEAREVGALININLENINQVQEALTQLDGKDAQIKVLESARFFMNRVNERLEVAYEKLHDNEITSEMIYESTQAVENMYKSIERETLIESTNNTHMETVMAETIVNYTIMEAFNTLHLIRYDEKCVYNEMRNNVQ